MGKHQKDRHKLDGNRRVRVAAMAGTKPTASVAKAFIRKAYACCTEDGK